MMPSFLHIRSAHFPVLPGEEQELVNPGTFGKALALYLQDKLQQRGYLAPFVVCEDWGWWVEISGAPFPFGVCIYCDQSDGGMHDGRPLDYFCTDGATAASVWSWRAFRFVDTTAWVRRLRQDLAALFDADPEVELVHRDLAQPWCPPGPETR
jgi:hypothetical protein